MAKIWVKNVQARVVMLQGNHRVLPNEAVEVEETPEITRLILRGIFMKRPTSTQIDGEGNIFNIEGEFNEPTIYQEKPYKPKVPSNVSISAISKTLSGGYSVSLNSEGLFTINGKDITKMTNEEIKQFIAAQGNHNTSGLAKDALISLARSISF